MIAKLLEYMHKNGIIIRNLSPSSFLMNLHTDPNNLEAASFRLSRIDQARVMGMKEFQIGRVGDLRYSAPEVIQRKRYDFKADSWSFGAILFYMLTLRAPFSNYSCFDSVSSEKDDQTIVLNKFELDTSIERLVMTTEPNYQMILANGFSKQSVDLVRKLLNKNPKTRLSIPVALKHVWFQMNLDRSHRSFDGNLQEPGSPLMANHKGQRRTSIGL